MKGWRVWSGGKQGWTDGGMGRRGQNRCPSPGSPSPQPGPRTRVGTATAPGPGKSGQGPHARLGPEPPNGGWRWWPELAQGAGGVKSLPRLRGDTGDRAPPQPRRPRELRGSRAGGSRQGRGAGGRPTARGVGVAGARRVTLVSHPESGSVTGRGGHRGGRAELLRTGRCRDRGATPLRHTGPAAFGDPGGDLITVPPVRPFPGAAELQLPLRGRVSPPCVPSVSPPGVPSVSPPVSPPGVPRLLKGLSPSRVGDAVSGTPERAGVGIGSRSELGQ